MSVVFGDTLISLRYGIVIGGLAAFGAGLARLRAPSRVQANEGMVLVALMFLFTVPFWEGGSPHLQVTPSGGPEGRPIGASSA
jgi:uncharacterized membrane protein YedE/YeeE